MQLPLLERTDSLAWGVIYRYACPFLKYPVVKFVLGLRTKFYMPFEFNMVIIFWLKQGEVNPLEKFNIKNSIQEEFLSLIYIFRIFFFFFIHMTFAFHICMETIVITTPNLDVVL